jgi:hypothetical protein
MAEQVRTRVLHWFARSGLIEPEDVREMLAAAPVEQILTCPSVSHHTDPRCWDKAGLPASRVIGLTAKPPSGSFRIAWTNPRPLGAVVPTTAMIFLSLIWDYRLSASLPWILDSRWTVRKEPAGTAAGRPREVLRKHNVKRSTAMSSKASL